MKKLILLTASMLALAGCGLAGSETLPAPASSNENPVTILDIAPPGNDWLTYRDPDGRFELKYPPDWDQTTGGGEIQFWDNFDDGVNSIKMALVEEPRTFEEIMARRPEDRGPSFQNQFDHYLVNGNPILVKLGWGGDSSHRIHYYDLGDHGRFAFIAWFHDENDRVWQDAATMQQSFKSLKD